jgi:hypothetical protein
MIEQIDLETVKSLTEAWTYIDSIKTSNQEERNKIRLKKGLYRKYLQEYVPLFFYSMIKYGLNHNIRIKANLGNENYDGIIYNEKSEELEKVEISYPVDGERQFSEARQLNQRGYTDIEVYGVGQKDDVSKTIIKKAKAKSLKDYQDKSLVIVLNPYPYFSLDDPTDIERINSLVEELSKIKFIAKDVFFLTLPYLSNIFKTYGNLWKVEIK